MLEYHTQGNNSTDEIQLYGVSYGVMPNWTPSVVFNGSKGSSIMMGPRPQTEYRERIDQLRAQSSTIAMTAQVSNQGELSAKVAITNLSMTYQGNARLYAVIYEDLNISQNHYVVRDITPEQTVTMPGHGSASYEIKTGLASNPGRHMVIILKSTSGTILQSQFVM